MATHLDLEEQEQLDQLKHFWNQYGNLITWTVILVLGASSGWIWWGRYQADQSAKAGVMFDELDKAVQAGDADKAAALFVPLKDRYPHTAFAEQGGTGVRGGPGETQIELDKRMIGERIKQTKDRLEKVKKQRRTQRKSRERSGTFKVSLVGYTNAGKSTLFNALVKADTYVANQLFATLDTTTRSMYLQQVQDSVSLSDTVGFIRDLPHGRRPHRAVAARRGSRRCVCAVAGARGARRQGRERAEGHHEILPRGLA